MLRPLPRRIRPVHRLRPERPRRTPLRGRRPDRSREPIRAPHAQPWKWVPCPHACGHVDQPEVRPSVLYGLIPQISPTATPADGAR
ncbi:hypothetical protein ACWCQN_39300 [Streptomyces sp. NPDC001984]